MHGAPKDGGRLVPAGAATTPIDRHASIPTRVGRFGVALFPPFALLALVLVCWELYVNVARISPLVLPSPSSIAALSFAKAPFFVKHFIVTSLEVVVGFAFAIVLGCGLGIVIAFSNHTARAVYPLLIGAQVTPKVAIAPLLIIWFGFELGPKVILTTLVAFFPIVLNTIVGMNMTRREQLYLFRSAGASAVQTFFKLRLPNALPVVMSGIKIASTLAVIGAVVGEFMTANAGLGYALVMLSGNLDTTGAFASVLYLILLGILVFGAVVLIETMLVPAHMRRRIEESANQL